MFKSFVLYFICLFTLQANALHVVFDLDWTLFYISNSDSVQKNSVDVVQYQGTFYRLAPGTIEVIDMLFRQGHEISIFSGGEPQRNQFLTQQVLIQLHKKNSQFRFFKQLDFRHLTMKSNLLGLRFADRWGKDLLKIDSDLTQIILIDDIAKFSLPLQQSNLMHLNQTYNDHPYFTTQVSANDSEYDPPNQVEWYKERHKLYAVMDRILALNPHQSVQSQLPNIMKKEVCRFLFIHD